MDNGTQTQLARAIRIVYLRFDDAPHPEEAWIAGLPPAVRDRLAAMRSAAARRQTLAGLWLLEAGSARIGLPVAVDRLGYTAEGQPVVSGGPVFSLSHAGDYCVCALADSGRLGVDVERERPVALNRLQRLLSPEERVAAAADRSAFFRAWTAREAAIKATGHVGLRRLAAVAVDGHRARIDGLSLHLQRPALAEGYALCVASDRPAEPVVPEALNP